MRDPYVLGEEIDGKPTWKRDDTRRVVMEYAADGVTVANEVAYVAEENTAADARATATTESANRDQIITKLNTAMADIQALLDTTNPTINAGPAPYIKVLARAIRLLIRMAIKRFDGNA